MAPSTGKVSVVFELNVSGNSFCYSLIENDG